MHVTIDILMREGAVRPAAHHARLRLQPQTLGGEDDVELLQAGIQRGIGSNTGQRTVKLQSKTTSRLRPAA